jgi:hypothetical protein
MSSELRIDEFAEVLRGVTPSKTTLGPDGPPFFGLHEITQGGLAGRFVESEVDLDEAIFLQPGDVVIALLGNIGDAAVVNEEAQGAVLGRDCGAIRLRSGEDRVPPQWLRIVLQSEPLRERIQSMTTGTTMSRLNIKFLASFSVPVPTADQIRKFADRVEKIEVAIQEQRNLVTKLTALRHAEIELLVSDLGTALTADSFVAEGDPVLPDGRSRRLSRAAVERHQERVRNPSK